MADYAVATSLKQTIKRLLNSYRISILSASREILEFAYNGIECLPEVFKAFDGLSRFASERVKALLGQMKEAACKLEDLIESYISDQLLSQSESPGAEGCSLMLSLDRQELRQDIDSFGQKAEQMVVEYLKELDNLFPKEEDDDDVSSKIFRLFAQVRLIRDGLKHLPETICLA